MSVRQSTRETGFFLSVQKETEKEKAREKRGHTDLFVLESNRVPQRPKL
jgi:hypothetical protein